MPTRITVAKSSILSAVGTIRYNGVEFGPLTETTGFSIKPVYDQAGRTVIYRLYSIALKGHVFSANAPASVSATGTLTNGSPTVTGLSDPFLLNNTVRNQTLVSGTGVPAGTVISKVTSATEFNLSNAATATGAQTLTFTTTTDEDMLTLRQRLLQNGGELRYERKGIGRILVNKFGAATKILVDPSAEASYVDVMWGPKPQLLSWKPRGSVSGAEVGWMVEFAVPDCPTADLASKNTILEFNFKLNFNIDRSGYTRRTYSGHLRVAGWRLPQEQDDGTAEGTARTNRLVISRSLPNTADWYRECIMPDPIPGFRREVPGDFTLDESKCRLDFSVVDTEMPPNIPPEGVVDVTASHSVRSTRPGLVHWEGTLTATYEMAKGRSGFDAFEHFQAMLKDRQILEGKEFGPVETIAGRDFKTVIVFLPVAFSMSQPNLYGREVATFSLTYTFATPLKTLVPVSGMWRPVPGSDWKKWSSSLSNHLGSRGRAGLKFEPKDEVIIDICDRADAKTLKMKAEGTSLNESVRSFLKAAKQQLFGHGQLQIESPPPESSWIRWENRLFSETNEEIATMKPLPITDGQQHRIECILQVRAAPTTAVVMSGFAYRAGHPVVPPTLVTLGGLPVEKANLRGHGSRTWIIANWGVPIHACQWSIRYIVKKPPEGMIQPPDNSMLGASSSQVTPEALRGTSVFRPTRNHELNVEDLFAVPTQSVK